MDMKMNLSEYYESILEDEMIAIVLAWIEKSGSITEEEILHEIGLGKHHLKEIVLKLYRNQFITVANDFLTISEQGKLVIDGMNLTEEIINGSFANLAFKNKERSFISNSIHWYRNNYYHQYLNTFTSLKYWNRFHDKEKGSSQESEKKSLDYSVIIFHDILQLISKEQNHGATLDNILAHLGGLKYSHDELDYTNKAYYLLINLASVNDKEKFDELDSSSKEMYAFLRCKNIFNSDYHKQKELVEYLYDKKRSSKAKSIFWKYNTDKLHFDHYLTRSSNDSYYNFLSEDPRKKQNNTLLDEFVFIMENASSLSDLSIILNKTPEETLGLLARLDRKIDEML